MAFVSALAELVVMEHRADSQGSTLQAKTNAVIRSAKQAFERTTGEPDEHFMQELQTLIKVFSADEKENVISYESGKGTRYTGDEYIEEENVIGVGAETGVAIDVEVKIEAESETKIRGDSDIFLRALVRLLSRSGLFGRHFNRRTTRDYFRKIITVIVEYICSGGSPFCRPGRRTYDSEFSNRIPGFRHPGSTDSFASFFAQAMASVYGSHLQPGSESQQASDLAALIEAALRGYGRTDFEEIEESALDIGGEVTAEAAAGVDVKVEIEVAQELAVSRAQGDLKVFVTELHRLLRSSALFGEHMNFRTSESYLQVVVRIVAEALVNGSSFLSLPGFDCYSDGLNKIIASVRIPCGTSSYSKVFSRAIGKILFSAGVIYKGSERSLASEVAEVIFGGLERQRREGIYGKVDVEMDVETEITSAHETYGRSDIVEATLDDGRDSLLLTDGQQRQKGFSSLMSPHMESFLSADADARISTLVSALVSAATRSRSGFDYNMVAEALAQLSLDVGRRSSHLSDEEILIESLLESLAAVLEVLEGVHVHIGLNFKHDSSSHTFADALVQVCS